MICRLTRFYGGTPEEWADLAVEAAVDMDPIRADEAMTALMIAHPDDPQGFMDSLRERATFVPDDESPQERRQRQRAKERDFLTQLGASLDDKR